MWDGGHHGASEHDERDVTASHASICLIVVEPKLILGGFKTIFDCPAMTYQSCSRGALVPVPADKRFQSDGCSVLTISAAVPETGCALPQE